MMRVLKLGVVLLLLVCWFLMGRWKLLIWGIVGLYFLEGGVFMWVVNCRFMCLICCISLVLCCFLCCCGWWFLGVCSWWISLGMLRLWDMGWGMGMWLFLLVMGCGIICLRGIFWGLWVWLWGRGGFGGLMGRGGVWWRRILRVWLRGRWCCRGGWLWRLLGRWRLWVWIWSWMGCLWRRWRSIICMRFGGGERRMIFVWWWLLLRRRVGWGVWRWSCKGYGWEGYGRCCEWYFVFWEYEMVFGIDGVVSGLKMGIMY